MDIWSSDGLDRRTSCYSKKEKDLKSGRAGLDGLEDEQPCGLQLASGKWIKVGPMGNLKYACTLALKQPTKAL